MFCSNCGKEILSNAKFCDNCGAQNKQGMSTMNVKNKADYKYVIAERKKWFLIAAIIATIFVALGGLFPVITIKELEYSENYSIKDIWNIINVFEQYNIDAGLFKFIDIIKFMLIIAGLCSIASGILCGVFVWYWITGEDGYDLIDPAKDSVVLGEISQLIVLLFKLLINTCIAKEIYGVKIVYTSSIGILLLIVPILCLAVIYKGYLGEITIKNT